MPVRSLNSSVFGLLGFLFCSLSFSQQSHNTTNAWGSLTVHVRGIKNNEGSVKIALHRTKETFLAADKEPHRKAEVHIRDKTAAHIFTSLVYGPYSVSLYHDINDNHKLDVNLLGIPVEPYGFSNNARGRLGPPAYEKTIFVLDKPEMTITIQVK